LAKRVSLQVHPDTPCGALTGIEVEVARSGTRAGFRNIALRFVATGNIRALRTPYYQYRSPPRERKDELWRHTCFEAFVRAGTSSIYNEFNLAPSGDWACYRFDDYRHGMEPDRHVGEPRIETEIRRAPLDAENLHRMEQAGLDTLDRFETPFFTLTATLDMARTILPVDEPWHLGLSAVIEERNGNKSYWALKHPPGAPDFHHPDCFALELPAARPA
jgi:hypothetical protein